jgi:carbonic anhydrase
VRPLARTPSGSAGTSPAGTSPAGTSPAGTASADPSSAGPAEALADLLQGNRRFAQGRPRHGHDVAAAAATSAGQQPRAFAIGCIDSRVPLEAIFDQTFGSVCVGRSGGQVLDRALIGSVEFAVSALRVPLVMVLGHERCGAVAATVDALRSEHRPGGALGYLIDEIAPAVLAAGLDDPDVHGRALRHHVSSTVARLAGNEMVAAAVDARSLAVVGAVYDLDTGRVELLR